MKTDEITVDSRGARMETALAQAEKVAVYKGLARKEALSLRLPASGPFNNSVTTGSQYCHTC